MTDDEVGAEIQSAFPEAAKALKQYVDILLKRGLGWGLIGPREGQRMWERHIANSLALLDVVPQGLSVADIGSGAGLPGLPLAITRPDLEVTLIEPLLRRVNFLELAVDELGLSDRVKIVRGRAEESKERFELVTCRAVAPLTKLITWTFPLFQDGGTLLALKGSSAEAEIAAAQSVLRRSSLRAEVLELRSVSGIEGTRAIRVC